MNSSGHHTQVSYNPSISTYYRDQGNPNLFVTSESFSSLVPNYGASYNDTSNNESGINPYRSTEFYHTYQTSAYRS